MSKDKLWTCPRIFCDNFMVDTYPYLTCAKHGLEMVERDKIPKLKKLRLEIIVKWRKFRRSR